MRGGLPEAQSAAAAGQAPVIFAILPFGQLGPTAIRLWLLRLNGQILTILPEPYPPR